MNAVCLSDSDLYRAVTVTSHLQLWLAAGCNAPAACPLLALEQGIGAIARSGWLCRHLVLGAQARPLPSICCHFHTGLMVGDYCWPYPMFICETSQVCLPQADCEPTG